MKIKVKAGDVFLIPIDDNRSVGGQLLANRAKELYVVVFSEIISNDGVSIEGVVSQKPMFLALTLDAKLWHGDWKIIGNIKNNIDAMPQPCFKIDSDKGIMIESRDQVLRRLANGHELSLLKYRTVVAPIRLEKAAQARFGIGNWEDYYNDLLPEYAIITSMLDC